MEKRILPLHWGSSSRNCSIAMSFKGMPFSRSKRSIPAMEAPREKIREERRIEEDRGDERKTEEMRGE